MGEISITNPSPNPDYMGRRRMSFEHPAITQHVLKVISEAQVTPHTHPKFIDLGTGDGSFADALIKAGWKTRNGTCVDMYRTNTPVSPLVLGVSWKYINLYELGKALNRGDKIPSGISNLKGKFDIAVDMLNDREGELGQIISKFFVRKGGFIYTDDPPFHGLIR